MTSSCTSASTGSATTRSPRSTAARRWRPRRRPYLDALAARGRTGTVVTVGPGIAPESDIGVFGILGYDPREEHPGRGVLEALGIGMDFRDGDLAYRVNFATADWPEIVDRRVGRDLSSDEAARARGRGERDARASRAPPSSCESTIEHRGALVIRTDEGALSARTSRTPTPPTARRGTSASRSRRSSLASRPVRTARGRPTPPCERPTSRTRSSRARRRSSTHPR